MDETLVMVTSDHGEEFFEHGGIGHRSTLLEEQIAIPMVMRLPGVLPTGTRVRGLGSHTDIFATVLDALGVPTLSELRSRSLLSLTGGGGGERHVLHRLVEEHSLVHIGGGPVSVNRIREVFRTGDIKVFRTRQWPEPADGCPPERAQKVLAAAQEARAQDSELMWIDVAEHPTEPAEHFSTDFSSLHAARALAAFRQVYREMADVAQPVTLSYGGSAGWALRHQPSWMPLGRAAAAEVPPAPAGQVTHSFGV